MTPDELRLILVDPKRVELTGYNGIPHLLSPVIVDAEHVVGALQWMMREMDNRYRRFSEIKARNIADFNQQCESIGEKKLPYLLIVIDELSDLMMLAPDETERAITRLAQLARATGIHLIIATQRPSTDILTGLIKANFPARIAFAVASSVDSRVILDQPGAERLLGRGDMLSGARCARAHSDSERLVSDHEINRLTSYWRSFVVSRTLPTPRPFGSIPDQRRFPSNKRPSGKKLRKKRILIPGLMKPWKLSGLKGEHRFPCCNEKCGSDTPAQLVSLMPCKKKALSVSPTRKHKSGHLSPRGINKPYIIIG